MKKKICILLSVCLLLCLFNFFDSLMFSDASMEEQISNVFEDKDISYIEFENGYLCLYFDNFNENEYMYVSYLKRGVFSNRKLNLRGLVANDCNYYLNNTNFERVYSLPLNNFSNRTIYFSCCENEIVMPVKINGEEVELYEIEIKKGDESYIRTFWFCLGKDDSPPEVEIA